MEGIPFLFFNYSSLTYLFQEVILFPPLWSLSYWFLDEYNAYHFASYYPSVEYDQLVGRGWFLCNTNITLATFSEPILHAIKIYFIFLSRTVHGFSLQCLNCIKKLWFVKGEGMQLWKAPPNKDKMPIKPISKMSLKKPQ